MWLIAHLEELGAGQWPSLDEAPDEVRARFLKPYAYFEIASGLAGDISYRLKFTKKDGESLVKQIQEHSDIMGRQLTNEALDALRYISHSRFWGFDKNGKKVRTPYVQWKYRRRYYSRTGK